MSSQFPWFGSGSRRKKNSENNKYLSSYRKLRCRKSNSTGDHVYISNCDEELSESDSEEEILELTKLLPTVHGVQQYGKNEKQKQKPPWHNMYQFIDHQVQQGDTLQIISMRYGCKVSELKRANNIINDREFYGFVKVKVPVKAYGVHFEQPGPSSSTTTTPETTDNIGTRVLAVSIAGHINDSHCQDGKRFLEKMDDDLTRIRQSLNTQKSSLEEVAKALGQKRIHPIGHQQDTPKGYSWKTWIVFLIILLLTIPIFLILVLRVYFK